MKTNLLLQRPESLNGISVPTVRNLRESAIINKEFQAVLTAGPSQNECNWNHKNHRVWTFDDTSSLAWGGPEYDQVYEMISWGAEQDDLLVHCHAGMSRSTATAWGVLIAKGADALDAFVALMDAHPTEWQHKRLFCPNRLLVEHIQEILGQPDLLEIREVMLKGDSRVQNWL
jgi:hypothetical protein